MITESGHIFTQDDYSQQYVVDWETVREDLDITTEIRQPYVWGEPPAGFIKNNILFRRGMITIIRQVIRTTDDGYTIIAEGSSQYIDYIQMNYPCGGGPTDPFKHHCDCATLDEVEFRVTDGPRWADPDEAGDSDVIWGDLNDDGSPVEDITVAPLASGAIAFGWLNIWEESIDFFITSSPITAADPLDEWAYTPVATIPIQSTSIGSGPSGMVVVDGVVMWTPTALDGGDNAVVLNHTSVYGDVYQEEFTIAVTVGPTSTIVGRYVFYEDSVWDSVDDDAAIATDKIALLPGVKSTLTSYTSYDKGLNGVMFDIDLLPELSEVQLTNTDFEFAAGGDKSSEDDPSTWATAPTPESITMRPGEGVDGSTRVVLIWAAADAVKKKWLQVTVKATANSGLGADDVFYFGNAIGDTGFGNNDGPPDYDPLPYFLVSVTDENYARNNPTGSATIDHLADFNRDGVVDLTDENIARDNGTNFLNSLRNITPPA